MSFESFKSVGSIHFASPTIDRPFGVELWPYFDQIYTSVMGYSPEQFRFVPGKTAMSTFPATASLLLTYYMTVLAGRELMKNRKPLSLNSLFMVHNLYLTIISGTLLALFIEQLLPTIWRNGIFFAICNHRGGWTDRLVVLYYVGHPPYHLDSAEELTDAVKLSYQVHRVN